MLSPSSSNIISHSLPNILFLSNRIRYKVNVPHIYLYIRKSLKPPLHYDVEVDTTIQKLTHRGPYR